MRKEYISEETWGNIEKREEERNKGNQKEVEQLKK